MLQEILKLVKNSENFVITSHVNPDGDSIGSEIAMYLYLKKLGKNVRVINYSLTPNNYRFLDENNIIEKFDEHQHIEVLKGADIIFILDTNEYSRIRTMAEYVQQSKAKKICIDHHLGTERNGFDYYILDTNSPATGEILFNFFEYSNNITMDKEIAEALYTAIMTDTGSFRFPRTDSDTHKIASKLIQAGADPVKLFAEVYDKATIGRLKLLSKFLGNIKL